MKTPQFPAPNGIPAMIGAIQCTSGVHVQANIISPTGQQTAAMQTTATMASGGAESTHIKSAQCIKREKLDRQWRILAGQEICLQTVSDVHTFTCGRIGLV